MDNVVLEFDREENNSLVFKTEAGLEVIFAKQLLEQVPTAKEKVYFTLSKQPTGVGEEAKQVLNELLDSKDN